MKQREFAKTGIKLGEIGLGCMGMSFSYGERNDEESVATLKRALELGVNFWDTADIYGYGDNERLIAPILQENRDQIFIATKVSFHKKGLETVEIDGDVLTKSSNEELIVDGRPEYIKKAIEGCLARLGVATIDLLYLHRVDKEVPIEETVAAMAEFVKNGKVKYLGLSECTVDELKRANAVHPISAVQSEYSILTRDPENNGILDATKEMGITFVPFSPLSRGIMDASLDPTTFRKGDFRLDLPRFQGEHFENNRQLFLALDELANKKGCSVSQIMIAWVLSRGDNIIPIPGTKRRKYLEQNAMADDVELSKKDLETIDEIIAQFPNVGPRYNTSYLKK